MKSLLLASLAVSLASAQPDVNAIVRRSIQNYDRDWRAEMNYGYTQTDITDTGHGKEVEVSEVIPLDGTPYEKLVRKNGRALTADEQAAEDRKYEKALKQREAETSAEREARIRKYETERAFVKEIPEAYDFKLVGEEAVDGRPAWVIEMAPHPGFVPSTPHAAMLRHIRGKLWIDKEDEQWAKAEADVIDTISFGWIVARVGPGAHFGVEQKRVSNGIWMPKRLTISGVAKVMMVHSKNLTEELQYSDYHEAEGLSARKRTVVLPGAQVNSFR